MQLFRMSLPIVSLWPMERAGVPCPRQANIGAASRPLKFARSDEELDSCFFNVDPHFDCRMQIEDRKNVIVDRVVFAVNAIHGLVPHGFALST
jgi:hypothetical protein